ncbi:hypothetical protein VTO73DRAFT_8128 [Trametes versicolor]
MPEDLTASLPADALHPPYYGLPSPEPDDVPTNATRKILLETRKSLERKLHRIDALLNALTPINKLPVEALGWTNGVEEVDTLFADDVLGVLRGAPLERLHIELPAREIGRIDWRAAFAPFHQLRQLSVRGTGTWRGHCGAVTLYQSLNPCLTSGAGVGTEMLERLVLPELRSLRIEGFDADDNTASVLKLALTNRMDFLGRPRVEALDELSFETSGYRHSEESFRRQRTAYQELFEPCVQRLTYAPGHGGPNW